MQHAKSFSGEHFGSEGKIRPLVVEPTRLLNTIADDVRDNLFSKPRSLPSKYFYDNLGSRLFERICSTKEYYLTRTEKELLESSVDEVLGFVRPRHIIEFGSGTSRKTRILLKACEQENIKCEYWPMDICSGMLESASNSLVQEFPWLEINSLVGDYHAGLENISLPGGRKLGIFLGSTIGNFSDEEADEFLVDIRQLFSSGDGLLIGADRLKAPEILNSAYDDKEGLTSRFNLNLLTVLNRELCADFSVENFRHQAFFNGKKLQVEMHLAAIRDHRVNFRSLGSSIELKKQETIRTEISRKYTEDCLYDMIDRSGFKLKKLFSSENEFFSLILATVP